ncbi:hypothetical protein AMECASPLE_007594 [Ameca splendens]|uniref:Secreted protein n=1 Tax=Ameca splendens TaxID=208324 RepID=A0ABV0XCU6_9TELE
MMMMTMFTLWSFSSVRRWLTIFPVFSCAENTCAPSPSVCGKLVASAPSKDCPKNEASSLVAVEFLLLPCLSLKHTLSSYWNFSKIPPSQPKSTLDKAVGRNSHTIFHG